MDVSCVRDGSTDVRHSQDITNSEKKSTPESHAMNGNKMSLNISVPTTQSDKLSVVKDKTSSSVKDSPLSLGQAENSTSKTSHASMFSKSQFQPIFDDMQFSELFKKTPPVTKSVITFFNEKPSSPHGEQPRQFSRFIEKEDEWQDFLCFQYVGLHPR